MAKSTGPGVRGGLGEPQRHSAEKSLQTRTLGCGSAPAVESGERVASSQRARVGSILGQGLLESRLLLVLLPPPPYRWDDWHGAPHPTGNTNCSIHLPESVQLHVELHIKQEEGVSLCDNHFSISMLRKLRGARVTQLGGSPWGPAVRSEGCLLTHLCHKVTGLAFFPSLHISYALFTHCMTGQRNELPVPAAKQMLVAGYGCAEKRLVLENVCAQRG